MCSDGVKAYYKNLPMGADAGEDWEHLLTAIMASKNENIKDGTVMNKIRTVSTKSSFIDEGGWIPYRRAIKAAGGEELLEEMVRSGSVLTRRNKQLPVDSKVEHPWNLEPYHAC